MCSKPNVCKNLLVYGVIAFINCLPFVANAQCAYTVSTTVTNVSCYNGTNGSIVVNVSGSTGPYQYQLAEAGAGAWQSSNTFTALIANTYPVSVKDASNCIKTIYVTVTQPAQLATAFTAADATCNNSNNGSIVTTTTGGTAPYTYNWKKDGVDFSTSANLSGLSPANYLLTVTDAKGCQTSPVVSSQMKTISLSGFNQDVIANGSGAANASTTQPLDDHSYVFFANGYNNGTAGTNGLPSSGAFNSAQTSARSYQLAAYSSANSLVLSSGGSYGSATQGTLSFATNQNSPYATLYVVGTTGNGTGTVNYTVNFSDNSTYTGSMSFPDWFLSASTASAQRALGGLNRVSYANPGSFDNGQNFNLFEAPINIPIGSQTKSVASIKFVWAGSSSARINLFAITGYTSTIGGIRVNNGPVSNVTPAVSVTSSAPSNTFCSGQSVTFTANPVNGGNSPTYQWYKNNVAIASANLSTYTASSIVNNDKFHVVMTSSLACVSSSTGTSSQTTMIYGTVPASVTSSATATNVCSGSPVTFTATPVNGGTGPSYEWQVNGTTVATGPSYTTTTLNDGDVVKVKMTSSIGCATGNPALSNLHSMTVTPGGEPSISIIAQKPNVTFTSAVAFGGTSPAFEWYKNGSVISGATGSSYFASNATVNDVYSVKLTSNYTCKTAPSAKSNYVTVSAALLPITLEYFTASTKDDAVMLNWKTSGEFMSDAFLIQRAVAGTDDFTTIANVKSINNANGSDYDYTDHPGEGDFLYRLVQRDVDGRETFYPVKTVRFRYGLKWQVTSSANAWQLKSSRRVQYELMSLNGNILGKGTCENVVNIAKPTANTIYVLRVSDGNSVETRKIY